MALTSTLLNPATPAYWSREWTGRLPAMIASWQRQVQNLRRDQPCQITRKALRLTHNGTGPTRGGLGGIITVPLSLTIYRSRPVKWCKSASSC